MARTPGHRFVAGVGRPRNGYPARVPGDGMDVDAWAAEIADHREHKDEFFAEHRQSPIQPAEREGFEGLAYYEPDPDYRVDATVEQLATGADAEPIELEMTVGEPTTYVRVGQLRFSLDGDERSLSTFAPVDEPDPASLFVPFRDATSGEATYGAGRYMELEVEGDIEDGDVVPLDFNLAYHPFCAYNDSFACPIPPAENVLDVAVEAGERC